MSASQERAGLAPAFAAARSRFQLVALLFAVAGVGWWWTVGRMRGMGGGPWTDLGTLGWFLGVWVVMMAAMMLPSVGPTVALYSRMSGNRTSCASLLFTCGYLVVSGEALLIIEGKERQLRAWDFVHCPPQTKHVIVGAGSGPCLVIAVGARERDTLGFTVDEAAKRHGASVEDETTDGGAAYSHLPRRELTAYRVGWLPG